MRVLLLIDLLIGGYNFGTIWAHEADIFRTWRLVGARFSEVQSTHWRRLPYWVFSPVALGLILAAVLPWIAPASWPAWGVWGSFVLQVVSLVLTATMWGPWQAKLSKDPRGSESPYLHQILSTHWIRTALYSLNALVLLVWSAVVMG
ncbi:hypothetical protein [Microbacterium capsulatum]|uniref:DUF1772 domain-containing protein n=1 Tax=Microbacterium capsulatum TaxID=3041921 RepID=A0ABU0XGX4_9MICO|nr:hypothetical protein [Microbacterium sp. ASV81]MDQ4214382.1 hypothetical protein [Microbacterium sp. ASV81]